MKLATLLVLLLSITTLLAQGPPGSEVYLVGIRGEGKDISTSIIRNVTQRPGYDNQPHFSPDNNLLYFTSFHEEGQTEIYRYDIGSNTLNQVTHTKESEYSPTVMPDGKHLSTVRVESDGTQRLWQLTPDGKTFEVLLENVKPVGYHAWINRNQVALFVLGEPHFLQVADIRSGKATTVAKDIGRSLHPMGEQNKFSFMHRENETEWWIKSHDISSGETARLLRPLAERQDYTWMPDGRLLMAASDTLFIAMPGEDSWHPLKHFAQQKIQMINRLAVSANSKWLAIVVEESAE